MEAPALEQKPAKKEDSKKSRKFTLKDFLLIAFLVILALAISGLLLFLEMRSKQQTEDIEVPSNEILDPADSGQRFWVVDSITPVDGTYSLALSSNAGNIKTYDGIISFGLSTNRELIALNAGSEIKIIDLNSDQTTLVEIPSQQFTGNISESISWSADDSKFAMGVFIDSDSTKERIWIFNVDGTFAKEIDTNLTAESNNSIAEVLYSPEGNWIMAKTFKTTDAEDTKEDGTPYDRSQLPIYLTIYSEDGEMVDEIMARDFDTSNSTIYYQWDYEKPGTINYYIYPVSQAFNPNQDYLFTKVLVKDE